VACLLCCSVALLFFLHKDFHPQISSRLVKLTGEPDNIFFHSLRHCWANFDDFVKITLKTRCTVIYGTPTMHISVLNELDKMYSQHNGERLLNTLRTAVTGGSFCSEHLLDRMRDTYGIQDIRVR